jgi:hypothetical protein
LVKILIPRGALSGSHLEKWAGNASKINYEWGQKEGEESAKHLLPRSASSGSPK